jgi:tetratricopeptide (TPR) repeat protein
MQVEMPSAGGAPYSYSRMVEVINASSAESGVSVVVKKQCADGTYMPADDADLKTADFDMKLSQCINAVKDLPRDRKLAFSREMRDAGNVAYANGDHGEAVQLYAQAMAGLDQSGDEGMRDEARRTIALPILTNMAASFLEIRRPRQALDLCDQALGIDGGCVKAHLRRGKALLDLDRYAESRASFDAALGAAKTPAETRDAEVYRRKVGEVGRRVREETKAYKSRLQGSFADKAGAGLYGDKPRRRRRTDGQVDEVLAECFDDATGAAPASTAPAARRPAKLDAEQKRLLNDALILLWMFLCFVVVGAYVAYGEALARHVTETYLHDDDVYADPFAEAGEDTTDYSAYLKRARNVGSE